MSSLGAPATAPLRGSVVGAASGALAIAAHGISGGEIPPASAMTLLIAVCVAVGAITATLPSLARGPLPLIAALGAGQLAAHAAMTVSVHSHSSAPGLTMLGAHAVATAVCAVAVLAAERLFAVVTNAARTVLTTPTRAVRVRSLILATSTHPSTIDALLRASISRRGPPVLD
ncbi:hypothetical protein [Rhodococcus sp. IEGM 1379]|uniref:hypothetical protein n=1 Tax=Rhodococcus sp. IEGM 1379 TaxID=3047086 RepID=UPI0024B71933|nr:hypothetical protein [Rhodococcus sp. IEGM 1379]MDI9917198.1 hypothetical protein [Rhodococcus sp. IEGM 1379]